MTAATGRGPAKQPRRQAIIALLQKLGPMTTVEIADNLEWPPELISSAIVFARRKSPNQVFRVVGYEPTVGHWGPDRPIYAAEAGEDIPKPQVRRKARERAKNRRWYAKHAAAEAAKKRAQRTGGGPVNVWTQLAAPELRARMTRLAANSSMRSAA